MKPGSEQLHIIIREDGSLELEKQPSELAPDRSAASFLREFEERFHEDAASALLLLGFAPGSEDFSPSLRFFHAIASSFAQKIIRSPAIVMRRGAFHPELNDSECGELLEALPFFPGWETVDRIWMRKVWRDIDAAFSSELGKYKGSVEGFISHIHSTMHIAGRIFFHLVESKRDDSPFAFLATYSSPEAGSSGHLPLAHALAAYGSDSRKLLDLLVAVNRAAEKSPFIAEILGSGEIFHPLALSEKEAWSFLTEIPLYEESGILCRIPDWWKRKPAFRVSVSVGDKNPSRVGMNAILDFTAGISYDGVAITDAEIRELLNASEGLALIKGRWIEVDHGKLKEALSFLEQTRKKYGGGISFSDAIRLHFTADERGNGESAGPAAVEISNGEWLSSSITRLLHPETIQDLNCGADFAAELRPYQRTGVNWLHQMRTMGFGACLADDMGLGKTVQVTALLNAMNRSGKKSLLVVPASLIANWMSELTRFAPALSFYVAHPSENKDAGEGNCLKGKADLVITTYALVKKHEWIRSFRWECVILDEAQAIKNPGANQTRAIKELRSEHRIVMTGTPVENHLSDLWSLFDFINPGLLGTAAEFGTFTKKLRNDPAGYARLRKMTSPFILRRLKTDRSVISDLPDKISMKCYAELTKKQTVLYAALVGDIKKALEINESGIARKGLILSSLMKLKQLCNHPDHYLGRKDFEESESGKFARLRDICETVYEKRERVLVFTQFREIAEPLRNHLSSIFRHEGLVLHGGVPVAQRKKIVERFQSDEYVPFMVLSLKAGGTGLNLTRANHVIHFDRWWNPAVENQATDRAFRIGQKKNVVVHAFVTKGTIEEKIDAIIEDKMKMAKDIVSASAESWLTQMRNDELMEIFSLGGKS